MNREETRKAAEVMMHYANGGEVQWRRKGDQWEPVVSPFWNWDSLEYRIKPQPIKAEAWAVVRIADGETVYRSGDEIHAKEYAKGVFGNNRYVVVHLTGTYTEDTP